MFVALYEMQVKPGLETQFEAAWAEVTDCIYNRLGSLGSRLHKTETPQVYIAYAQWPARDAYFAEHPQTPAPEAAARARMKAVCTSIKTLHLMHVTDDRLQKTPGA